MTQMAHLKGKTMSDSLGKCLRSKPLALLLFCLGMGTMGPAVAASSAPLTYTAQHKPRITVMDFTDTNSAADQARYGPSVSAMLVTFLKQRSQFVVVERQDIRELLSEWKREQEGDTDLLSTEDRAQLLERIEVILQGKVTVLAGGSGHKIEIDAKLLSVEDGRIVTAAKMHGPQYCLRQIVERLGAALEHEFLRPFFGSLTLTLDRPENARLYLTPILREDAPDEEKPPVEHRATLYPDPDWDREGRDVVESWITNPTSYTIENLLSGWYLLRVGRPGYEDLGVGDLELRAAEAGERLWIEVRDRGTRSWQRLDRLSDRPWSPFVVQVPRLDSDEKTISRTLEMTLGSLVTIALDEEGAPLRGGRVLLRSLDLDINRNDPENPDRDLSVYSAAPPLSQAGPRQPGPRQPDPRQPDPSSPKPSSTPSSAREQQEDLETRIDRETQAPTAVCDLVGEKEEPWIDYPGRVVRPGDPFDATSFRGGLLAFEDYEGERVPTGIYEVVVWSPGFLLERRTLRIEPSEEGDRPSAPRSIRLTRRMRTVTVLGQAEQPIRVLGETTGLDRRLRFDAETHDRQIGLPVDRYRVTADLGGFGTWASTLDLLPAYQVPPRLEQVFLHPDDPAAWTDQELPSVELKIKDGLWTGGRNLLPLAEAFHDPRVADLLDRALEGSSAGRELHLMLGGDDSLEKLRKRLRDIDLLVLDEDDLQRLKDRPEVSAVIRHYVSSGHALLAFVNAVGSYDSILGTPLTIPKRKSSRKLRLDPGEVSAFSVQERMRLSRRRPSPRLQGKKPTLPGWRVLAYEKKGKRPRLLERDGACCGGYVMVWLEDSAIRARSTASAEEKVTYVKGAQKVKKLSEKQIRRLARRLEVTDEQLALLIAEIGDRALDWATYLMHRRLGGDPAILQDLAQRLGATELDSGVR